MHLLTILSLCFISILPATDAGNDISTAIKTGNAKEVAKFFSESVDLKILDKEDVYSKPQAELILKDFFFKKSC